MNQKKTIDKPLFCKMVSENEEIIFRAAMAILNNQGDAMEAVGKTIVIAYENLAKLKDVRKFKFWILRILIKESRRILRQRHRMNDKDQTDKGYVCR